MKGWPAPRAVYSTRMHLVLGILALIAIAVAALAAVTIAGMRMSRDARRRGTSGSLSSAMLEVQSLIDPSKKKVVEAQRRAVEDEENDEIG